MQRAALGREERVAEASGFQEGPAFDSRLRLKHVERVAAGGKPVATLLGPVARLPRDADEAAPIEMALAEIAPHLVPRFVSLGDQPSISRRGAIGASDDAMMIARCRKRVGNFSLFDNADLMTGLDQRPGRGETSYARSDDNDVHFVRDAPSDLCGNRHSPTLLHNTVWRGSGKPR
jgi:hypothetical protein